jgi:hypothetical protein
MQMSVKTTIAVAAAFAIAAAGLLATSAFAKKPPFPTSSLPNQPSIAQRLGYPSKFDQSISGTWTSLIHGFPAGIPDTALLLTDGSVVMHEVCRPNWFRLVPDRFGSYIDGSWSELAIGDNLPLAPMIGSGNAPDGYGPYAYASAVLPDGRLIVNGGEDVSSGSGCAGSVESAKGSLYKLTTFGDRLNDIRCQIAEPQNPADMSLIELETS